MLFSAAPLPAPEEIPPAPDETMAVQEAFMLNEQADLELAGEIGSRSADVPDAAQVGISDTINIVFDYSYDSSGFFDSSVRRSLLNAAANEWEEWITDDLSAIIPSGDNRWRAYFTNPSGTNQVFEDDLVIPFGTIRIFVGARYFENGTNDSLAVASAGSASPFGNPSAAFRDTVERRGQGIVEGPGANDYSTWGGRITFNRAYDWFSSFDYPSAGDTDFFSTAVHEIGHILGISEGADSFKNLSSNGYFYGPKTMQEYGGPVPLHLSDSGRYSHWGENVQGRRIGSATMQEVSLDPNAITGGRKFVTYLDLKGLDDIGWDVGLANSDPVVLIDDQRVSWNDATVNIPITALDAEGEPLFFSAEVLNVVETEKTAYDLDQAFNFSIFPAGEYFNANGASEKYVNSNFGSYFIVPTGEVFKWNGSIAASPYVATLDASYHQNITKMVDVVGYRPDAGTVVNVSVVGDEVVVNKDVNFAGKITFRVWATDGFGVSSKTFTMTVVDEVPVIQQTFQDVNTTVGGGPIVRNLNAYDPEGRPLTYYAEIYNLSSSDKAAFDLDRQYGFSLFAAGDYYNANGYNERYVQGFAGGSFFIVPTGELFKWNGSIATSTYIGKLDSSYHQNISKLVDVANYRPDTAMPVRATVSNGQLTIDRDFGFVGKFSVKITVTDGIQKANEYFNVLVSDSPPVINPIADLEASWSESTVTVPVSIVDPDNVSATVAVDILSIHDSETASYNLDQSQNFSIFDAGEYFNANGYSEKYVKGISGSYFIIPTGEVFLWNGSIASSPYVITLDPSFHRDITKMVDVREPFPDGSTPVTASFSGNSVVIEKSGNFAGKVSIRVSAFDGVYGVTEDFDLLVTDSPPVITLIPFQELNRFTSQTFLPISIHDPDGTELDLMIDITDLRDTERAAYEIDQSQNFSRFAEGDYFNANGYQEKYVRGRSGSYFIIPTGEVFLWNGSIASSLYVTTLDHSYYRDLSKMVNVPAPVSDPNNPVDAYLSGGSLVIQKSSAFAGVFTVRITATDTYDVHTRVHRFNVLVPS